MIWELIGYIIILLFFFLTALDAYCLLEVYDKLCYFVQKFDLKFNTKEKVKTKWLKLKVNTGYLK